MEDAWLRRNSFQLGPVRIGKGSILCLRRMAQMVEGAKATPSLASRHGSSDSPSWVSLAPVAQ